MDEPNFLMQEIFKHYIESVPTFYLLKTKADERFNPFLDDNLHTEIFRSTGYDGEFELVYKSPKYESYREARDSHVAAAEELTTKPVEFIKISIRRNSTLLSRLQALVSGITSDDVTFMVK